MKLLLLMAVGALVIGCSGRQPGPASTPASQSAAQGDWFCQMDTSGDGWDCVRDPRRARRPDPVRVPEPPSPVEPGRDRLPTGPATTKPEPEPTASLSSSGPAQPPAVAGAGASPIGEAPAGDVDAPDYLRLAYVPPAPTALADLSGELYAVQLMAMSTKESLEQFVDREGISGVSAARVERDGKLYYVLILGVYESAADARRAVASLPAGYAAMAPWIRPLRSLQAAIVRADAIAGSTRY